jgi:hypothetical protein
MSGYSVSERKLGKERKPAGAVCGGCGEPVVNGKLLCDECITEIAQPLQVQRA